MSAWALYLMGADVSFWVGFGVGVIVVVLLDSVVTLLFMRD